MHLPYRTIVLCAMVFLGACSTSTGPPRGDAVPPPSDTPHSDTTAPSLDAAPKTPTEPESAPTTKEATQEKRKSDTEACYSYAAASVRNEARLDHDRTAGRGSRNSQFARYSVLTNPMNNYYYQKQQQRLFEACMQQKGYIRK